MTGEIVVFVTCPRKSAEDIAAPLVTEGLAACVNVIPQIRSIYMWKGDLCREGESLLLIKTLEERFSALEQRIKELHSYEVPEIICVPIKEGYQPYLDWIRTSVMPPVKG